MLVNFCSFLFILVHFGLFWFIWLILVHFGSFWFILIHFGSFWFIFFGYFRYRHKCLVDRLLSQGYIALRLEKSFKKFYGRYQDLIEKYQRSVNVMVNDSFPG